MDRHDRERADRHLARHGTWVVRLQRAVSHGDLSLSKLLGILNLSEDSFSDGGLYRSTAAAITQAMALSEAGAWAIDVGAVSSNPDAAAMPSPAEVLRLQPVIDELDARGIRVSVDTFSPDTQRWAAPRVAILNDIRGFPDPSVWPTLAASTCSLIVMHQVQQGRADRRITQPQRVLGGMFEFFDTRLEELERAGIERSRLIVDPGMGFFLGSTPEPSIEVLKAIPTLKKQTGCPVLVGVSRKSFLGAMLGGRPPNERHAATLAAELYAIQQGADWIRTHDVRSLRDASVVWERLHRG